MNTSRRRHSVPRDLARIAVALGKLDRRERRVDERLWDLGSLDEPVRCLVLDARTSRD
jgi:hypothetical protein